MTPTYQHIKPVSTFTSISLVLNGRLSRIDYLTGSSIYHEIINTPVQNHNVWLEKELKSAYRLIFSFINWYAIMIK